MNSNSMLKILGYSEILNRSYFVSVEFSVPLCLCGEYGLFLYRSRNPVKIATGIAA